MTETRITETSYSTPFPEADEGGVRTYDWARSQVLERTNKKNIIPFYYREVLKYMISKLGTLNYLNSEDKIVSVKCLHSNPERAIAKLKQENNIILPIISISQTSSDNDDSRRRQSGQIVNNKWWSDEKKRAFRVLSVVPRAININYNINVWAKYGADLDQLVEQVRLLFNPDLPIEIKHSNTTKAFVVDEEDQSTVEASDREDRILRKSFTVSLEGYIPNPKFLITSTGEIEEFNLDVRLILKNKQEYTTQSPK